MKIASSIVAMNAQTNYYRKEKVSIKQTTLLGQEKLRILNSDDKAKTYLDNIAKKNAAKDGENDENKTSNENQSVGYINKLDKNPFYNEAFEDAKFEMIKMILDMLNGKPYKPKHLNTQIQNSEEKGSTTQLVNAKAQPPAMERVVSVLTVTKSSTEIYEKEQMSFASSISVKTEDGRTINIDLELNMSREFYAKVETQSIEENLQKLCDPLVMNFKGNSTELADTKFSFDLDCDGKSDQISQLKSGSGFLALDKNGDGAINDGSELFGAKSGNGFYDLSQYDTDNNGWIDENDDIFDKLRIWTKDKDGKDKLIGLGEVGVGAIFLGYAKTDYSLKSGDTLNGMIKKTGVFLNENGTAGTIQHVDYAI